jgi:transcriptional antiterminator RfaH
LLDISLNIASTPAGVCCKIKTTPHHIDPETKMILADKKGANIPGAGCEHSTWYVAQLRPGGFARAQLNLRRQGVETFMPLDGHTRVQKGKRKPGLKPLFPGYIFLHADPRRISFQAINCTYGISRLVMRDRVTAQTVPQALISDLWQRCDAEGRLQPPPSFRPGEAVRIIAGPFAEFVATVESLSAPERLRLLFEMMGQTVRVELAGSDLERLG